MTDERDEMVGQWDDAPGPMESDDSSDYGLGLFDGDQGRLPRPERRCLVTLVKSTHISHEENPDIWATLLESEAEIRSRLHDLMLDLQVDMRTQVAYAFQISDQEGHRPVPRLKGNASYTREQTLLLVHIRDLHRRAMGEGHTAAYVDNADLLAFVADHRPASATNRAFDARKTEIAIEQLKKWRFLHELEDGERWRISDVIETVMDVTTLQTLLARLDSDSGAADTDDEHTSSDSDDPADELTDDEDDE